MEMGKGERKWMESDGVVDGWMRKRRGAEEEARGGWELDWCDGART